MTSDANDTPVTGRPAAPARRAPVRRAALAVLGLAGAAAAALGGLALAGPGGGASGAGGLGWTWYKTDTHVHSSISGDAAPDLGIIATAAKANHYNALFLTDHNLASTFPVGAQTSVDVNLDDAMPRWFPLTQGDPTKIVSMTNALEGPPAPVLSGVQSLHLAAKTTAGTPGEVSVWTKRGANLRSGDDVLTVAVFPKTVSAGAGLYVSAALGGDPTVAPPPGYTTAAGVISPGLSKVFIYYLGAPPPPTAYPGSQLFTFNLGAAPAIPGNFSCDRAGVVLNQWTRCTINLSKALPLVAQAERPLDYNAFGDLKIAATTQGGQVDGYFDAYRLLATAPADAAGEYVFRNGIVSQQDTADFKIYPSVELGIGDHVGRFDFGFSDPTQFRSYKNGIEGIVETHATGYPAQVDHPGVPGGVTDQELIANDAFGADAIEVRFQNMIDDWDALLSKGLVLTGSWATDNHNGRWSGQSQATFIQAPTLGFDDLMHSFYEGRSYLAMSPFAGRLIFGPDAASPDPHPARYPVFVSPSQTTAPARLVVTNINVPSSTVVWITNGGTVLANEPAGSSYDAVKQVPLTGPSTYVRAEVRDAMGIQDAMTQPIVWKQAAGLPSGVSVGVEGVTTPNGIGYTNVSVRGATGATWDAARRALTATLDNPAGSLVELRATTAGQAPSNVAVGGTLVPRVGSLAEVQTAVGPAWAADAPTSTVRGRAVQNAGPTPAVITFAGPGDAVAPSAPSGLVPTLTGPTQVTLGWTGASDAVGVAAYDVYRNGLPIARLPAGTGAYVDDALALGETHRYAVDAVDAAGNQSLQSNVVTVSTAPKGTPPPPPPPPPTTTSTPVKPPPPESPLQVVQGAFRGAATQPHGEGFGVSLSLAVGRRPFELAGRPLRRLRLVVSGQSIVQDPTHARAVIRHSGLPGRRITVVGYGGTLYVSRRGSFRTAVGALRTTLPPLVASGFGQSPATFAGDLVKLRDLGPIVVGVAGSRRYRAALTPAALRRYLSGLLVQGGLAPARAKAAAARARVTLNQVDMQVVSGQLDRVSVSLGASLGPAKGKGPTASISVRANVDLTDHGAELAVRRPAARGVFSALGQLR
ncbi:MAG: endoglucanase [Miltoncostaeaceae bacterium]|jgi:hypothetical protein|nr:endoglucanase [Miltoncostaeaceae bacterium]